MSKPRKLSRGGPLDFCALITVDQAKAFGDTRSAEELMMQAMRNNTCLNCDLPEWRYAGVGLCFPCTTGEADASGDYELAYVPPPPRNYSNPLTPPQASRILPSPGELPCPPKSATKPLSS